MSTALAPSSTRSPHRIVRRGGPLRSQLPVHSPLAAAAVALGARSVFRLGPDPRVHLERLLRERFAAERVVLCGSGTQALLLAIRTAIAAQGVRTVALPAFSCFDVAAAAVSAGARIRFYDVDVDTLGPEPASFRDALRDAAVAVVGPLYGVPLDWEAVSQIAAETGALVIEDAAQGAGARSPTGVAGALGPLSVLSFGRGKGWTGGGGGALLLRRDAVHFPVASPAPYRRLADPIVVAGSVVQLALGRPEIYRVPLSIPGLHLGETVWRNASEPHTMTRASAAIAVATATASQAESQQRAERGARLASRIPAVPGLSAVRSLPGATYLRFPIRIQGGYGMLPDPVEARRLGIAASYPLPLPELTPVRAFRVDPEQRFPGAELLARELVTLPTHGRVTDAEIEQMLHLLHRAGDRSVRVVPRS